MVLTNEERIVLRDVLDIEIDAFEDAMHDEGKEEAIRSWDSLLSRTGSYGETIAVLRSIRKKVSADVSDG
jgi:hypothetical protein